MVSARCDSYTKISEVNFSAFIHRLFDEDCSSLVGIKQVFFSTNYVPYV